MSGDARDAELARSCLEDKSPVVRAGAVYALAVHGGPQATRFLIERLRDPAEPPAVLAAAAWGLARRPGKESVAALTAALERDTRGRAPRALGLIGDAASAPALKTFLTSAGAMAPERRHDRAEALWALARVGGAAVLPFAREAMKGAEAVVRFRALEALATVAPAEAAAMPRDLVGEAPDTAAMLAAVARRPGPRTHTVHVDVAFPEPDALRLAFGEHYEITAAWGAWETREPDELLTPRVIGARGSATKHFDDRQDGLLLIFANGLQDTAEVRGFARTAPAAGGVHMLAVDPPADPFQGAGFATVRVELPGPR